MSSSNVFRECNHTELYQLCRRAGINVSPALSREELAQCLTGELPDPGTGTPMDAWREGLLHFAEQHWSKLQNVVTCPLKNADGGFNTRACYGCLDTQVVTCVVANKHNETHIAPTALAYRKREEQR